MISLRKYLYAGKSGASAVPPEWIEALISLPSGVMEAIRDHVLRGTESADLRTELESLHAQIGPELTLDAATQIRADISRILASYAAALQRKETNVSVEMQQLLGTLNQALIGLASGNERSLTRLHKIQESLQRTSLMQDMTALKSSLAQTMQFIREESNRENQASAKELVELETELGRARELMSRTRATLPGRPEGVRHISEELRVVPPQFGLYLLAYRFERLQALIQRYGADAGEDLIFRVIRERVQPVAPAGVSFRWTPSSLVAVFQRPRNLPELRAEAAALNRNPLVYRLPLGNRTAMLTVHPSHLIAEGAIDSPESLIAEADHFTGAAN